MAKTTRVNAILLILRAKKVRRLLCTPHGPRRQRMSETPGAEATTIHRLLEVQARHGHFARNEGLPPAGEQMALPGGRRNPDPVAARSLLKPGRRYEQAAKAFEPYDSIQEENPEARAGGRALVAAGKAGGRSASRGKREVDPADRLKSQHSGLQDQHVYQASAGSRHHRRPHSRA